MHEPLTHEDQGHVGGRNDEADGPALRHPGSPFDSVKFFKVVWQNCGRLHVGPHLQTGI